MRFEFKRRCLQSKGRIFSYLLDSSRHSLFFGGQGGILIDMIQNINHILRVVQRKWYLGLSRFLDRVCYLCDSHNKLAFQLADERDWNEILALRNVLVFKNDRRI